MRELDWDPTSLSYRQYPPPESPWIQRQTWSDLLFAHWPVELERLRPLVPPQLPIDLCEGWAWIGIVPFYLSNLTLWGVPPLPWISRFPELNVRTYVTVDGKPGIYFFSLDAGNPLAVLGARLTYLLPYYRAAAKVEHEGPWVRYSSRRTHRGAPQASFQAQYRPVGPVFTATPGSLEYFLTARYCLFTVAPWGSVYRGDIHHRPWPLQDAEAQIGVNTLATAQGLELPALYPLVHYVRRIDMVAWPPRRTGA